MTNRGTFIAAALPRRRMMFAASAGAQEAKHYRFAHDQQLNTGYSVAYDMFSARLKELSKGTMLVDQYPGAQLGQEPQLLQLVKSGDIDFAIVSSANTATISPQAGVMSLHFLFRTPIIWSSRWPIRSHRRDHGDDRRDHAGPACDRHRLAGRAQHLQQEGNPQRRRHEGNQDPRSGHRDRGQMFPAYGAQTVHMPFGSVYTSLQTGVMDAAENSTNVYLVNKHYEVAPVLSITEHEANNALLFVSDKLWQSLSADQKQWVKTAAAESAPRSLLGRSNSKRPRPPS